MLRYVSITAQDAVGFLSATVTVAVSAKLYYKTERSALDSTSGRNKIHATNASRGVAVGFLPTDEEKCLRPVFGDAEISAEG